MTPIETIRSQPYLNFNEQKALEEITHKIPTMFPFINSIMLYSSKVRGDLIEESDIDVLFMRDYEFSRENKFEVYDGIYEISLQYDEVISSILINISDFRSKAYHSLRQVRMEGVTLWSRE